MADDLLSDIHAFLAETGMSSSYFGRQAAGNSELVGRLEDGKTITLVTAEKVRDFMRQNRHWRKRGRDAA